MVALPSDLAAQGNIGKGCALVVTNRVASVIAERLAAAGFRLGAPVFVRIFKKEGELENWLERRNGQFSLFKAYKVCNFSGELGPKQKEGDDQSPEGFYFVTLASLNSWSRYHLSFNLGYPNRYDRLHARTGSALMVHCDCVSIGCYPMGETEIEEIYTIVEAALRGGQPFFRVHAFPFRMTEAKMSNHAVSVWKDFWLNLKQGYDHFETLRCPPNVSVDLKRKLSTFEPS